MEIILFKHGYTNPFIQNNPDGWNKIGQYDNIILHRMWTNICIIRGNKYWQQLTWNRRIVAIEH